MRRRDFSLTTALCASLAAHAAFIRWRAEVYVRENEPIHLPGFDRTELALASELPVNEVDRLGDAHAAGYATDSAPGELTQLAPKADDDQSFLSRDPEGPGKIGSPPAKSTAIPGEYGQGGARQANQSPVDPTPPQQAFGIASAPTASPQPQFTKQPPPVRTAAKATPVNGTGSTVEPPTTETPAATVSALAMMSTPKPPAPREQAKPPQPQPQAIASAAPGRPGPDAAPADPAPQAESESDPFAIVGSLEFRQGNTKVRMGRKHIITRPKLSWDTQYDFFGMTRSALVLDLQLDTTGHVTFVGIDRSSGSQSVDQPCRIAAYDWWFEPAKDPAGHPIRDDIKFTIKFL